MKKAMQSLQNAELVSKIQQFFGVKYEATIQVNDNLKLDTGSVLVPSDDSAAVLRKKTSFIRDPIVNNDKSSSIILSSDVEKEINDDDTGTPSSNKHPYIIQNKIWYYIFLSATYLGDELGYALFIPFLFWNINVAFGRKMTIVWTFVMYVGQVCKEIIRWPRPASPPVIRLQKKWSPEYGMPSTHSMACVALPISVLYFYHQSNDENHIRSETIIWWMWAILSALLISATVSFSRLYLGMHSIADVLAGIILSVAMLLVLLPSVDALDNYSLNQQWYPVAFMVFTVCLIMLYPKPDMRNSPTRADTTIILGTCVGLLCGCWINRFYIAPRLPTFQYADTWTRLGLRSVMGYASILTMFGICDVIVSLLRACGIRWTEGSLGELAYKYVKYIACSINVASFTPFLFYLVDIARPAYYFE